MPTFAAQKFAAVPIPGTGASCAKDRPPIPGCLARIASWIVRVHAVSSQRVVVARHPTRHPVGEFCHSRLGDDDGAASLRFLVSVAS